jgi:hypothetical protein
MGFHVFYWYSRRFLSGLDVVWLQEALQVQDHEFWVLFSDVEELAQRGIGVDDLLVHQALGLGVVADGSGNFAAAHQGALWLTQEDTEVITDLDWLLEDAFALWLITFSGLGALALLAGLLQFTWNTLFQLLHVREDRGEYFTEGGNLGNKAVEFGNNIDFFNLCSDFSNWCWGSNNDWGGNNWSWSGNGWCSSNGFLLGGGLAVRGLSSSAHLISGPKEVYACSKRTFGTRQFWSLATKKTQKIGGPANFLGVFLSWVWIFV